MSGTMRSPRANGQVLSIRLNNLGLASIFTFEPDHLKALLSAFEEGTASGMQLRMRCRPGDRIRRFLADRSDRNQPLEITPWSIPGINEKGLTASGDPVTGEAGPAS